jgi:archaeal flagellar protein FlaI
MAEGETRGYQIVQEGRDEVLKIEADSWTTSPSIEDQPAVMGMVVRALTDSPGVKRIVFHQRKNFMYPYDQTLLLAEISRIYNHFIRDKKILSMEGLGLGAVGEGAMALVSAKRGELQNLVQLLPHDPLGCYVEGKRFLREEKIALDKESNLDLIAVRENYIGILREVEHVLEGSRLVSLVQGQLEGHAVGDRDVYRNIFRAAITPDFMYTRLRASLPMNGEEIDLYTLQDASVTLLRVPEDIKLLYHVSPIEFSLTEDEYLLLDIARGVMREHKPREEEFLEPARMRMTFFHIGKDLLQELSEHRGISLEYERIALLARILVRYTVGFGLIEVLMQDEKVQDIVVNSPAGSSPMFIVHQDYGECATNIVPSREDVEGWATKFRLLSGRPLDEANPVLDTELIIPGARGRVAIMTHPLSPTGLAYAIRRHRDKPWTLPLFIANKMVSPLGAGLMSFMIDGARTMLVAGTRSSGKTSFLSSMMVEIMRKYRIVSLEDTLEMPVDYLREMGYNIQHMKVRSALTSGGVEVSAEEGIRTALRLGDSSLIIGEVRSVEAKALYEAMRIGALANVVAGTIHGADPYGVFDRVVNDLGVPKTSFKATDVIIVANPIKSPDGLKSFKRVLQIAEVRKHWTDDPLREGGFVDLMTYDGKKDLLVPTDDLRNGDSEVLKAIAGTVKEWAGDWDALWSNILLRARIKERLVDMARIQSSPELLEADFVVRSNDAFHLLSEQVFQEVGGLDSKRIYSYWNSWLERDVKKRRM